MKGAEAAASGPVDKAVEGLGTLRTIPAAEVAADRRPERSAWHMSLPDVRIVVITRCSAELVQNANPEDFA